MKTRFLIILISLFIFSCGGGNKQEQLVRLKKQYNKLALDIKKLEDDITASGDSLMKNNKQIVVSVNEIKPTSFDHYIEVQGKLDGDQNVAISPMMSGKIVAVYAQVGDEVKKGQLLAQIDDEIYQQQLKDAQTMLDFVVQLFNKQEKLWKDSIGSEIQYLQAKANKESTEKKVAMLKEQIDMMKIKSPINGAIAESNVKVGQMASPQLPVPAYRIISFNSLKVTAEVSESYSSKINKGDKVLVYFPDISKNITGIVDFASDYINPINRTFKIEIKMVQVSGLKANMITVVKINDYHADNCIALPINYIQQENKVNFVYRSVQVENKWIAKKQIVELGQNYNGITEISKGLKPGDKIITAGYLDIEDGNEISF